MNNATSDIAYSVFEAVLQAGKRHEEATVFDLVLGVAAAYKKLCKMGGVGDDRAVEIFMGLREVG